ELEGLAVEDLLEPAGQRDLGVRRREDLRQALARSQRAGDREVLSRRLDPADEDRELATDHDTGRARPTVGHGDSEALREEVGDARGVLTGGAGDLEADARLEAPGLGHGPEVDADRADAGADVGGARV